MSRGDLLWIVVHNNVDLSEAAGNPKWGVAVIGEQALKRDKQGRSTKCRTLVELTEDQATTMRTAEGIESVERARDGIFRDDDYRCCEISIEEDGTYWEDGDPI